MIHAPWMQADDTALTKVERVRLLRSLRAIAEEAPKEYFHSPMIVVAVTYTSTPSPDPQLPHGVEEAWASPIVKWLLPTPKRRRWWQIWR